MNTVLEVLKLRQAVLRVTTGKLQRGIDLTQRDDRLYDMHAYHAAHTGRVGGRGIQILNLPRGKKIDLERFLSSKRTLADVDLEAEESGCTADDVLATLIRPCLMIGSNADYNAIELRCVAWMAGQESLLDKFRNNLDPYIELATQLSCDRFIGKTITLGSIYGMSASKFDMVCKKEGIDLEAAGLTAQKAISAFRQANPAIVRLWRRVGKAILLAVRDGRSDEVGRCKISYDDDTLRIQLPSTRTLNYRSARIEKRIPAYAVDFECDPKDTVVYTPGRKVKEDPALWGSKVVENMSQAICRDLLYEALIRVEAAGLRPVIHVYDQIACESPDADELKRLMEIVPAWATGFPVLAEAKAMERFQK